MIKIEHLNAQSILSNKAELEILMNERNPDILCVTETWLTNDTNDAYIDMPDYNVYRCDKGRGGGACIYVKSTLEVNEVKFDVVRPQGIEDVWLSVQSCKFPSVVVGCVYRHPKAHVETFDYISDVLTLVCLKNKPSYILGDFNDDLFCSTSKMNKIINTAKLTQLIAKPTRVTNNSATLLDLIITNSPNLVLHSDTLPCPVADHELITVTINLQKPKRVSCLKTIRDLGNYSPYIFCNLLSSNELILNDIFKTDDVDIQVDIFTLVFNDCLDKCAPFIIKEVRRPPAPWINDDLRDLMVQRNNTQKLLKDDRLNVYLNEQYKNLKKEVKRALYNAKTLYYNKRLEDNKGNISATWNLLKKLVPNTKNKTTLMSILNEDQVKVKANNFNTFFANVGKVTYEQSQQYITNYRTRTHNNVHNKISNDIFRPQPTDATNIVLVIKHLHNTSSYGCDGIPLKYLRESLPVILPYLTCIINTSIVTGTFPTLWKHAIITPIHKSGNINEAKNYRPISLLPIISKVLERIIAKQLTDYLGKNKLLSDTQHGFRPSMSTETALLTLSNELYNNMDNKNISLITLCDLSKAFHSVSHATLLNKLSKLGIDKYWFESYLGNRTQSVKINNFISDKQDISFGVPQGSVLGPILFLIFVNDLSEYIPDCTVIQYADDTQFVHKGSIDTIEDLIRKGEETLKKAKEYFNRNGLMLNTSKTQCMFVGTRGLLSQIPEGTHLNIDNVRIDPSDNIKNLGIYFDKHMTFEKHIDKIGARILNTIIYINRTKEFFNRNAICILMQSLALSIINYGLKIWGTANKTNIKKIQKLQNFAAKVALGGGARRDPASPFIRELGWLKVHQKYKHDIALTVFNILRKPTLEHLFHMPFVSDVRTVNTRQSNQLHVPRSNTCTGARSLLVEGPMLWNSLPSEIKSSQSSMSFKNQLYKFLFHEQCSI